MEIERRSSPNLEGGRGGDVPRAIVLHTTQGSFAGAAGWFATAKSRVSAHYLVGLDGRLAQFVEESDTARHAGRVRAPTARLAQGVESVNSFTVGIEFEDGGDPLRVERPPAQYEAGAELIADIAMRWGIPLDREHVIGHREVFAAKDCPGNLDLDRLVREARRAVDRQRENRVSLAFLLPARDATADLPGYLRSVAAAGGSVVALDDGSADATADLLEASPLVEVLLRNPRRQGFAGWDDGANRARLLEAAAQLDPDWVLFLDVDERIEADDAEALRRFLLTDAIPGIAYGLKLFRNWGERVVATPRNVYRLFAFRPGLTLPEERLHFNPVPEQIPRAAWLRTTIRVRHLDDPERLSGRRTKYREADPEGLLEPASRPLLDEPEGELVEWEPRPPGLGPIELHRDRPREDRLASASTTLVCLLPARNCEDDVPGYLDSAAQFADAVVALDDGSTDGTATALEASPLVAKLLRNPPRSTYRGWDDAANRQRLLDAAGELAPRWVMFLDADERIDRDDAQALRRFVEEEADPEAAYGFRVYRMVGDESRYDRAGLWVYRLFRFEPGLQLPDERLHLVPVPTSIPRSRWKATTIRIKHLAGLTEERRQTRLRKYEEADPELRWQGEYERLLLDTGTPRPWRTRPDGLPVLADPLARGAPLDLEAIDPDAPLLSAIVISRDDEDRIERAVRSVVEQECPAPFEVIVVVSGRDATAAIVRERFPKVTLVELDGRALPGRARNAGLSVARGEYVSFPGSHVELPPGSLAARIRAHEAGWPMVTGSIVNGTPTRAGWASYFLDHSGALPDRPSGELAGAPAHCSYVRQFLLEVGGFPESMRAGEDTVVNHALWRHGHRAYRSQDIRLTHRSRCTGLVRLIRHHFVRGRALGRILGGEGAPRRGSSVGLRFLAGYARRRLEATDLRVAEWGGELAGEYRRARPLAIAGIVAAWAGTGLELALRRLRPRSAAEPALRDPPTGVLPPTGNGSPVPDSGRPSSSATSGSP